MKYLASVGDKTYTIEINQDGQITVDGVDENVDFRQIAGSLFSALLNNASFEALVEESDGRYHVMMAGELYDVEVADERRVRLMRSSSGFEAAAGELSIRSPMPGLIVAVGVAEGQAINKGDSLCILESMKMENDIKAPRAGTVGRVYVAKGDRVEQNKVLVTIT
ncbi:MAG TPA: biotin/lipoyl-containing protein [Aggregatilineales bacterium]|nr:biotin/lipoyl-containing protein [Aggregatilineales bacterium]